MSAFESAIVRAPAPSFAEGLTRVRWSTPPSFARLLAQHQAYVAALERLGLAVEQLPALPALPDAYFVEDAAVVVPELAVLTRPGAASRRPEVAAIEAPLAARRPLARIEAPGLLDGGDVLVAGREIYVGLSARTNLAGARALAELLEPHAYRVTTIPVAAGLHLKSSVNLVAPGLVAATAAFAEFDALARCERIVVADDEAAGANLVRIRDHVLVAAGYPELHARLRERGFELVVLDMSEVEKLDGGLSCLSLRL